MTKNTSDMGAIEIEAAPRRRVCVLLQAGDESALHHALALSNAEVTAIGVFPGFETPAPCQLAAELGCDEVIWLRCETKLDYLGEAELLLAALEDREFDLIVACDLVSENASFAVSAALAGLLQHPHLAGVLRLQEADTGVVIERQGPQALEFHHCPQPAVLALLPSATHASPASVDDPAPVQCLNGEQLGAASRRASERAVFAAHARFEHRDTAAEIYSDARELLSSLRDARLWRG